MKRINLLIILWIILQFIFLACSKKPEEIINKNPEIQLFQISNNDNNYQPNEPSIAINPTFPQNIIAGSNRKYYYYSLDGGTSWKQETLECSMGVRGDPCLAFDANGNAYYSHLAEVEGEILADRMIVQKSNNKGQNWDDGVGFNKNGKQHDREWMVVDRSESIFKNNIYVSWTQYDEYGNPDPNYRSNILFSHSSNEGESFSEAIIISDVTGDCLDDDSSLQGAKPATGPNGEVFVCWSGNDKIMFDRSFDGGESFSEDIIVAEQTGGWGINIDGVWRADGCPSIVCDNSDSKYKGDIYISWSDIRNGSSNTDVFISKSSDNGLTWTQAKRVNNDDTHRQQFFPSMTIDQTTGYVYLVFYDRRNTEGTNTDVFLAVSKNGGESFENHKINEKSFDPQETFLGDYTDIDALNNKVYASWTELTNDMRKIIVGKIDFTEEEK